MLFQRTPSHHHTHLLTGIASTFLLLGTHASAAKDTGITLVWDANPEPNIAKYVVRYGTQSGKYTNSINAGPKTKAKVPDLKNNTTYYFVVFAYNKKGLKSPASPEISYAIDGGNSGLPKGTIAQPSSETIITAGESINFAGNIADPKKSGNLSYRWTFGKGSGVPGSDKLKPGPRQFNIPGVYQVTFTATNSKGKSDPTPATRTVKVRAPEWRMIPRKEWNLRSVDSQQTPGYPGTAAFDADPKTFWHTQWKSGKTPKLPHDIEINLGKFHTVTGFRYLPRQDDLKVGNIAKFEFYVSDDGKKWGNPVATGLFSASSEMKQIFCRQKRGKFIRLRALTEANGRTDTNVAELFVLEKADKPGPNNQKSTLVAKSAPLTRTIPDPAALPLHSAPALTLAPDSANPARGMNIQLQAPAGTTCMIQASADLQHWQDFQEIIVDSPAPIEIHVPTDPRIPQRYFRVRFPQ